ncbi:MAG TPA: hypothetical protein VK826_07390 [Bacteroidia bacterium]|nr:hypothetical protein [Bacteroidia bacterium]
MFRTSLAPKRLVSSGIFVALAITLAFTSCKKEDEPEIPNNPPAPATAYSFPLTDGSYWIYQHEQTDSAGNITQVGTTDSVYVDGDTTVGANTYKKIRTYRAPGPGYLALWPLQLLRDSAGFIVDVNGEFIEHTNHTDTLLHKDEPGFYNSWYFMRHIDSLVTVPAGTFTTIDYEGHVYASISTPYPSPRYIHQFLADGIGTVMEVKYYFSQSGYIQRRLISYHIQ